MTFTTETWGCPKLEIQYTMMKSKSNTVRSEKFRDSPNHPKKWSWRWHTKKTTTTTRQCKHWVADMSGSSWAFFHPASLHNITYSICRIPTLISLTVFDNFNLQEVLKTSQHQLQSPGEEPKWAAQVEQKDQCQGSHDDCRFHLDMSNEIPRSFRSELIDAKPGRRHHLPEWRQTHK